MKSGKAEKIRYLIIFISLLLCLLFFSACNDSQVEHVDNKAISGDRISTRYMELSQNESVSSQESYALLMTYCSRFLSNGGKSKPEIETFLLAHIGERAAGYGFVNLVKNEIDIPFTAKLKSMMIAGNKTEEALFNHSEIMFDVVKIQQKMEKTQYDWERIVTLLEAASIIKPSYRYYDLHSQAYGELGMNRELFVLNAYRSFDLGKEGLNGFLELRSLWKNIEGEKQSFQEEINSVNVTVMEDIVNSSKPGIDFQLDDEVYLVGDSNNQYIVDFKSDKSPVYNKYLAVAVFSTNCHYCEDELKLLSKLASQYAGLFTIVALREREDEEIEPFGHKNRISIPLLINDESRILEELDVSPVPVLFLFNDEGFLIEKVRFRSRANLEDKIRWILDDAIL